MTKFIINKPAKTAIKKNTNYGRPNCDDAVWLKADKIPRKDPNVWRRDATGRIIKRNHLNSKTSKYAWNIDHIIARTRGGSDDICNLQPLNRVDNIRFSNKLTNKKPNYSARVHHNALLISRGLPIVKLQKPALVIGQVVYSRQSPVVHTWAFAKIMDICEINDSVTVKWVDADYVDTLLYDALLFDTNFVL
jgi:hypothetical protein